ncbi:MAG: hypothetical protein IJB83_03240 [Bacilli bacterium]|nr:hypothetical protein [Bacilli bacterium]
MKGRFILDYLDENNFKKLERSLKKYNMVAYKKLMFDYYPKLRSGEFVGDLVSIDKHNQTENYDLRLPTDSLFVKVYGEVKLNYTVYKNEGTVLLNNLEPKGILLDGHKSELTAYKGIMISKANAQKEMFKIDLLCKLEGRD